MEKMTPICSRMSLILTLPMGKGAFVKGVLSFHPFTIVQQASYGLRRNFKICGGDGMGH